MNDIGAKIVPNTKTAPSFTQAPEMILNAGRELQKQVTDPKSQLRVTVDDPKFRERLPVIGTLGRKFGAILLERTSERLRESMKISGNTVDDSGIRNIGGMGGGIGGVSGSGGSGGNMNGNMNKNDHKIDNTSIALAERLLSLSADAASTVASVITPTTAFVKNVEKVDT